jgi:hypothetical protein
MKLIEKLKGLMPGRGIDNAGHAMRGYGFMTFSSFGKEITLNLNENAGLSEAYERCSTVSTVIWRNTSALLNGRWWIVDKKENDGAPFSQDFHACGQLRRYHFCNDSAPVKRVKYGRRAEGLLFIWGSP